MQVSLVWRYIIAAAIMFVWVFIAGKRLRFSAGHHVKFALMGLTMFCLNFALFYHASVWLASGLLSVIFSLASIVNILIAVLFLGIRPGGKVYFGAALGIAGIVMMFWPVIAGQSFNAGAMFALLLCIIGTISFCLGNLVSAKLQRQDVPVISASAWGMAYGVVLSTIIALVKGDAFIVDWNATYLVSLVFLAIVSSVVAFAAYLTLLGRIGADRAGYATVMFPVVALIISSYFEDYRMDLLAMAGLALVLGGNIFVLQRRR